MSLECVTQTSKESASSTGITLARARRVFPRRGTVRCCPVPCSAAANMPDCPVLHLPLACLLTLELFIEGEDGFLRAAMDVACATSPTAELGAGQRKAVLEERSWAACCAAVAGLGSFECVACAATAGMDVFADSWMWFSERILRRHAWM